MPDKTKNIIKAAPTSANFTMAQVQGLMREFVPAAQHTAFQKRLDEMQRIKSMKMRDELGG